MSNIFEKFEGRKVRVQILNSFRLPVDHTGYVEVEDDWAYLCENSQEGNKCNVAINTNMDNVVSIEVITPKDL